MGNDGGTIARGQDLRAVYAKNDALTHEPIENLQNSLLSVCSLTSLPLYEHGQGRAIVSDYQGKLYLKEQLLEFLLSKRSGTLGVSATPRLDHINGLGDFIDVHVTWSPLGTVTCPVTKTSKTPKSTFVYLRPCGCVFSSRLLSDLRTYRKVPENEPNAAIVEKCPNCSESFAFNYDVVILNPQADAAYEEFNSRNFKYLTEKLHVGHAKKPQKKRK
ncbi:hypothetical protein METBIDRAFT_19241, partial [Metschnikowia bicuspidata var. bicuspidata NRRL YB-4993]